VEEDIQKPLLPQRQGSHLRQRPQPRYLLDTFMPISN